LEPVDGGAGYLQQFASPFPAGVFPIGVWMDCMAGDVNRVNIDKSAGINVLVAPCHDGTSLSLLRSSGMYAILHEEWVAQAGGQGAESIAWMGLDEIDMQRSAAAGCAELQGSKGSLPRSGRFFWSNFGKGVEYWLSNSEAACYLAVPDVPSVDLYWMTDENACSGGEGGNMPGVVKRPGAALEDQCKLPVNYGLTVQRMRSLISPARSKPVWNFVELGRPWGESNREAIPLPSIRAAVWHSIIAGAMGITYFNHSFQPLSGCGGTPAIIRDCPDIRSFVTGLNAEVQGLAPVLYAPRLSSGFSANANVRALAKWSGGKFYVIAAQAAFGGPLTGNFSIGCVGNATATVLGENRTIPVTAGAWSDNFADMNAVHIYRIDGGTTCGLS